MGRKYTITRPSMFDLNTIIDIELDEDDVFWTAEKLLEGYSAMSLYLDLRRRCPRYPYGLIREAQILINNNLSFPNNHPLFSEV